MKLEQINKTPGLTNDIEVKKTVLSSHHYTKRHLLIAAVALAVLGALLLASAAAACVSPMIGVTAVIIGVGAVGILSVSTGVIFSVVAGILAIVDHKKLNERSPLETPTNPAPLIQKNKSNQETCWVWNNEIRSFFEKAILPYHPSVFLPGSHNDINVFDVNHLVLMDTHLEECVIKNEYVNCDPFEISVDPRSDHEILHEHDPKCREKRIFAYLMQNGGNHWVLLVVDRDRRTVEYYDSKASYGNIAKIKNNFTALANTLSEKDLGKEPYTFIPKIKESLQPDSYQCGIWACYFLEKRLNDPHFDFNTLGNGNLLTAQKMIADYRSGIRNLVGDFIG